MRLLFALAFPLLVVSSFTAVASADVPKGPSCKCSTPGAPAQGALGAALLGGAGLLALVARGRRRR